MKKTALIAAALAMVLSLTACGNKDNNTPGNQTNGNGITENGTVTNGTNNNGTTTNGTTTNGTNTNGTVTNGTNSNGAATNGTNNNGTATNGITGSNGSNTGTNSTRSSVGNDLRRAADDMGDAVRGMVDDGRSAVNRSANTTSFQRMLNNARVHDMDGVLTDGENSRW